MTIKLFGLFFDNGYIEKKNVCDFKLLILVLKPVPSVTANKIQTNKKKKNHHKHSVMNSATEIYLFITSGFRFSFKNTFLI